MTLVDSRETRTVYLVAASEDEGTPIGSRGQTRLFFYRSRDHGRTFDISHMELAGTSDVHKWFWNAQLAQLRDGSLVVTYAGPFTAGHGADLFSRTSTDQGATWSRPVRIRDNEAPAAPKVCGAEISGLPPFPSQAGQTAVIDGRTLAVASFDRPGANGRRARIVVSVSGDDGRSWHPSARVTSSLPVTMASVADDDRGHLAVVYDEVAVRRASCSRPDIPARTRLAVRDVRGSSWRTVTLGPAWWNFASAGKNQLLGWWFGEFQSLTSTPQGFTTVTSQARRSRVGRCGSRDRPAWSSPTSRCAERAVPVRPGSPAPRVVGQLPPPERGRNAHVGAVRHDARVHRRPSPTRPMRCSASLS